MSMVGDERMAMASREGKRARGRAASSANGLAGDPLYAQLQGLLQQGRWPEAQTVLNVLVRRHGDSAELEQCRQVLGMRISAEVTWADTRSQRLATALAHHRQLLLAGLRQPGVRVLLAANALVYLLLALAWLLEGQGLLGQ